MKRYAPHRPFPPYTYVPGQRPHPFSDPQGHSFRQQRTQPGSIDWHTGKNNEEFRYAVDLFNHGYYWEAHEAWEGLWVAVGRKGPLADLLKGFIHLAAAGVKQLAGIPAGVRSHLQRAKQLFHHVQMVQANKALHLGCNLQKLMQTISEYPQDNPAVSTVVELDDQ